MATKIQTPRPPIKPEREYKTILYRLITAIQKNKGEINEADVERAINQLPALFSKVKNYSDKKYKKLLEEAIGKKKAIELFRLYNPAWVDVLANVFLSINVGLIKSVSVEASQRIMREIAKDPANLPPIIDRIQTAGNLTRSRARTIARTEMAKLNADMTKTKSIALGISEYEWRTAGDERVRADHEACDGKTYRYGQMTDADSGAEPSQDVNCRCTAIAIITDDVLGQIL